MTEFLKRMRWTALLAGYAVVVALLPILPDHAFDGLVLASAQSQAIQALFPGATH